jgi:hypothetical protein
MRRQGREPALWLASPHCFVAVAGRRHRAPHSDARSSRHATVLTRFRLARHSALGRAPAARRSRGRAQPLSQAKGQPPGSRAPVVGVELHMHRDVGVCSIGHDELTVVLLLRRQRSHATPPAPGLWNGRVRGVSSPAPTLSVTPEDARARGRPTLPATRCRADVGREETERRQSSSRAQAPLKTKALASRQPGRCDRAAKESSPRMKWRRLRSGAPSISTQAVPVDNKTVSVTSIHPAHDNADRSSGKRRDAAPVILRDDLQLNGG